MLTVTIQVEGAKITMNVDANKANLNETAQVIANLEIIKKGLIEQYLSLAKKQQENNPS